MYGGGWFTDDISGAYTMLTKSLIAIAVIILIIGVSVGIYYGVTGSSNHSDNDHKKLNPVGPDINKLPGTIDIVSVGQAPSAGQAIVYFSKHEAEGTTCDTCEVEFSVNLNYTGGSNVTPVTKTINAPLNSGTMIIPYWISIKPAGHPAPPTSVQIDITARVVDSTNPSNKGRPISYSKTLPYIDN